MENLDAMQGLNRALRDLAEARGELQGRVTAALAFRAAQAGKAAGDPAVLGDEGGVIRARRAEMESSLAYLARLESSVEEARRAVAHAERAWLGERASRT